MYNLGIFLQLLPLGCLLCLGSPPPLGDFLDPQVGVPWGLWVMSLMCLGLMLAAPGRGWVSALWSCPNTDGDHGRWGFEALDIGCLFCCFFLPDFSCSFRALALCLLRATNSLASAACCCLICLRGCGTCLAMGCILSLPLVGGVCCFAVLFEDRYS